MAEIQHFPALRLTTKQSIKGLELEKSALKCLHRKTIIERIH